MRIISYILLLICIGSFSCTNEPKEERVNVPMKVARVWLESYYYTNNYDLAKSYSTASTSEMIDTIKTMIFPDLDGEKIKFKIENITCKQVAGVADCTCKYLEEGEAFSEELHLVKVNGQWLVDAKLINGDDVLEDKEIEKMSKDFEKSLESLLEK